VATVAFTAALVAEATGGRLAAGSPDAVFSGVSIDSRTTNAGALFVAIQGDRFDGHEFVTSALSQGASGLLVSQPIEVPAGVAVIAVPDTLQALQDLARDIRRRSRAIVVAITGSAGKTSTKELTADLLATRYRVFPQQGQPQQSHRLAALAHQLSAGYDMAVVELGMNHAAKSARSSASPSRTCGSGPMSATRTSGSSARAMPWLLRKPRFSKRPPHPRCRC
jgi:UDP-N-acetylmuramyl pentapeptide synthase